MSSEEFYQISRTYNFVFTFEYVSYGTNNSVNIYCNESYMGVWSQHHGLSLTNERNVIQDGLNTEERMQLIRHIAKFVLGVAMERKMVNNA